jgi:hypothetical protein
MKPEISICLPTLDSRRFLTERLESIRRQSFSDWEIIAVDSHSEDGTLETLRQFDVEGSRIHVHQAARDGIYPNINRCIGLSRAPYIYIATSDDTMAPDCLEKLLAALKAHPECDLAHCPLRAIDETGRISDKQEWWSRQSTFAKSSGELLQRAHVRRAPFDGLLHFLGETVYTSMTQLLIRRSLFDRIGLFDARWGSVGDFNWDMRAGLVASTVHVPDTWGGWRIHANQATAGVAIGSAEHSKTIEGMIENALASCEKSLAPRTVQPLSKTRELREFLTEVARRKNSCQRKAFIILRLLALSPAALGYLKVKSFNRPWPESAPDLVRTWLEDAVMEPVLVPCRDAATAAASFAASLQ